MLQEEQYATASRDLERPPHFVRAVRKSFAGAISRRGMRDGILSVADQAVVSGTSFVTSVIIGRICSKRELGVFYLALTIVYFARGIQDQLVSAPYVIHCHKRRANSLALYSGSSLLHHLLLSLASIALLGGAIAVLSFGSRPAGLVSAFWVLLGALPLLQLREFVRRLTTANLQLATAIAIDVSVAVLQIGGLLLLAYFDRLTVGAAYAVMGAACAVASCGWFFSKRQPFQFTLSQAILDWRHNWGFARWALASHLVGFSGVYLLPWIVTAFRGSEEAGVLAASLSIAGIASMFMTGLAGFLLPKAAKAFAQNGVPELRRVLRTSAVVYATALGAFALFVMCTGDLLLVVGFGEKYSGNGVTVSVAALSMLTQGIGLTAGIGLWAIERPKSNLAADLCTLAVTVTIVVCLLEPLGVLGAVLGDLGGRVAGTWVRIDTLNNMLKAA